MMRKNAPAPTSYSTSSKVAFITNEWEVNGGNVHTKALEDRGQVYVFAPTALSIHQYVATWFWDQEVFDYIARHLPHLRDVTCRLYFKAAELKEAGDDWEKYILTFVYDESSIEYRVIRLMNDRTYTSNNARGAAFEAAGYGHRSTFYRHLGDLEERYNLDSVPMIEVRGRKPEPQPDPMLDESWSEAGRDEDEEEETNPYSGRALIRRLIAPSRE